MAVCRTVACLTAARVGCDGVDVGVDVVWRRACVTVDGLVEGAEASGAGALASGAGAGAASGAGAGAGAGTVAVTFSWPSSHSGLLLQGSSLASAAAGIAASVSAASTTGMERLNIGTSVRGRVSFAGRPD
jgi:hypothetical protein